ncbi:hypothetical protein ACFYNO_35555 [Kitasatospora sp. NPDC006697]|uniref:hypothetical protein n=1 Tax=Kitasatospora sp. NPDC006697 TaxID=3364020 RepID=UPI0036A3599C
MTDDRFGQPDGAHAPPSDVPSPPAPAEEQAVRALLHRSVDAIQPAPDALARIRRAVPARRARYRQAWTGAALIVVLSAVAVPTLRGLGALQLSDGSAPGAGAPTVSAGSTVTGVAAATRSGRPVVPLPVPEGSTPETASSSPSSSASAAPAATPSASAPAAVAPPTPAATPSAVVPACQRPDLGGASVTVAAADPAGRVYGTFTVANVSGRSCKLSDPGTLGGLLSAGGTVRVLDHTAGDPASGLPAPAAIPAGGALLAAGGSYQLPFAWVPDAACPAAGGGGAQTGTDGGRSTSATPSSPTAAPASQAAAAQAGGTGSGTGAAAAAQPAAVGSPGPAADGGASPAASPSPAPSSPPSPSPSTAPSSAPATGTLTVALRPLGTAPDAASTAVPGVCGGGTLYRGPMQ